MTEEEKASLEKEEAERKAAEEAAAIKAAEQLAAEEADAKAKAEEDIKNKSYVKIREEKAQEKLLKQLGVKTLEEAQEKLNVGSQALTKVNELEIKLQKQEQDRIKDVKTRQLTSLLENEKVFDSEALLHYVDIDAVELSSDGKIKEPNVIISQLKTIKPNYFGSEFIKSDAHFQSGQQTQTNEYADDYKNGNYVGAIAKYLKNSQK